MEQAMAAPPLERGQTFVFVGTTKGLWTFASKDRRNWERYGPYFAMSAVQAVLLDTESDPPRLYSPAGNSFWGHKMMHSDDLGATWTEAEVNPRFGEEHGVTFEDTWALAKQPGTGRLFAGVEPAAIFTSDDRGRTWQLLPGLWNHPHRPRWQPGFGGLCLHTILFHPQEPSCIFVAISAGGVYRSDDDGVTWKACNKGLDAGFMPVTQPEFGQCVHKIAISPARPDRIYLQNHGGFENCHGVYRSDDRGETWIAGEDGLPGNFGFPVVAHPRDPDTAYVIPLDVKDGAGRWMHEGRARVYRTRDACGSWEPLSEGLPQKDAYFTVLRDGFTCDGADPLGLYFGTRSGHVYYSADEGESWALLADKLPPVVAVKAYQV